MKPCRCGSDKPRYRLNDARGLFCAYVCQNCEAKEKQKYRPEIFTDSQYFTDEPIDE